jgi:hypothetical protein
MSKTETVLRTALHDLTFFHGLIAHDGVPSETFVLDNTTVINMIEEVLTNEFGGVCKSDE